MIGLAHGVKIYLCTKPTDMRKSFDGLCGLTDQQIRQDPLSGHRFLFRNRSREKLKTLYWDQDGLAIWYKRLEQGTFQFPTDGQPPDQTESGVEVSSAELSLLLGGIDLRSVKKRKRFERPKNPKIVFQFP